MGAARWFIVNRKDGGKLAVTEAMAGGYAAAQRTVGFKETIATECKGFEVVDSVFGNWDGQLRWQANGYFAALSVSKILPFSKSATSEAGIGFWHSDKGLNQKFDSGNISKILRETAPKHTSFSFT